MTVAGINVIHIIIKRKTAQQGAYPNFSLKLPSPCPLGYLRGRVQCQLSPQQWQ